MIILQSANEGSKSILAQVSMRMSMQIGYLMAAKCRDVELSENVEKTIFSTLNMKKRKVAIDVIVHVHVNVDVDVDIDTNADVDVHIERLKH